MLIQSFQRTVARLMIAMLSLLLPLPTFGQFVAYNDLAGSSSGNVTSYSIGASGQLVNHATGAATGVTLQVTGFANAAVDGTFSVPDYGSGDAASEFGTILNNDGYIRHDTVGQGYVELRFTGLNPAKRYTVVMTGERGNIDYTNRNTKFTLTDVDSFTNSSSAGIPHVGSNWVEFNTGYNVVNGFVARFSDINPGADGDMLVTAGVGTNSASGHWYLNSLKLVESAPTNAVIFAPNQVDAVVGSADVGVTLSIPAGSNSSSDVQVTLTSSQPSVAEPLGASGAPLIVTFPAGGSNQQAVPIDIGGAGSAGITTTNNAGLTDAQLTVTVAPGAVSFVPNTLTAPAFAAIPLKVALTPGSNQTRAVQVTVSSDHPAVAVVEGAVNGSFVLTFTAGGPFEQTVTVNTGLAGGTTLRTTNDGGLGNAALPVQVTPPAPTGFTAYNDVVYDAANGHPALTANVTTFNIGSGSPGPTGGILIDKTTGSPTNVTATLTQSGGVNWQPSSTTGGSDCNLGTDARQIFDPATTVSLMGTVYYGSTGWWVDVTFTGLNPSRKYEFATTANRNDSSYAARITRYTLSGADAFANASSAGTSVTNGGASTAFSTGYNTVNGHVARWVEIDPGADGSFKVRAEAGSSEYRAYAFDAFMLAESGVVNAVRVTPAQIVSVVGAADVDVAVSIPPGANASTDVHVTLTSDQPAVAEPLGASGSPFVVTFLAGGPSEKTVAIDIGAAGSAAITTTNDADLTDALLTATVSVGSVFFVPDTLSASIDTTVPITVGITPGSNDTRDVQVTLSTADASIAVPQGAVNGSLVLSFTAGSPSSQSINIEVGQQGTTSFSTTNDGGLGNAVLPVQVADLSWIRVVVNPYADVDWGGFERHKANMHTHTTQSDGSLQPAQVIDEYHARGYTILAITDHNRCTWPWQNWQRDPAALGMLDIAGNEPSDHHHMNSFFINFQTNSTNLEQTITEVGAAGGLVMINHPGRYTYTLQQYLSIYTTYGHVFGMEVINQGGRYYDVPLWDQLLGALMPGRPIWGLACDDMHQMVHLGRDWLTYLVPPSGGLTLGSGMDQPWPAGPLSAAPDEAVVRNATERGQYYFSSLGTHPEASRNVNQTPLIDSVVLDQSAGTITVSATSGGQPLPAGSYRWISMGQQVHLGPAINFRTTPGVGSYVRAELVGQGGTTFTNPFGIATVGPTLEVSKNQIIRSLHIGGTLSDDTFTIANSGPATLNYAITWNAPWLVVSPETGESSGEADTINISYDLDGLLAGQYSDQLAITSLEAGNSPLTVLVTVNIQTVSPDLDGDGDVDQADFGWLQKCLSGSGVTQNDPQCEGAKLDGDGDVDGDDISVFAGCLSGAGVPADPGCAG